MTDIMHVIAQHRRAWAAIGDPPEDEGSPEHEAWEARCDAAYRVREELVDMPPGSEAEACALAGYVAGHECSNNIDRNDGPVRALRAIMVGLGSCLRNVPACEVRSCA